MKPYLLIKKILDFIFALVLLTITFPIMILISIIIKIESKGPILFKQKRPGKNAKIFKVYKFRTMRTESEEDGILLSDMERITPFGDFLRKTSLDELPQLFNILKGEMSFIGPRPLLIEYLEYYSDEQSRRHEATPGISGLAQVKGRNAISWEEKFEYDLHYVDQISFILDFKILFLTIYNVLCRKDINSSNDDTMPYFKGSSNQSTK